MSTPEIPSLPTDNLYKFAALTGLVLLLAAIFLWANFYIHRLEKNLLVRVRLLEAIEAPYQYYIAKARAKNGEDVSIEQKTMISRFDEAKAASDQALMEFNQVDNYNLIVTRIALCLGFSGIVISTIGFRLWYLRVQKPLDRILLNEARKKNNPSPKPGSSES